jgi:ribosomal protein S18 acetylase RimI-like enzyme
LPTSTALDRFAVTPAAYLPPASGRRRIETARWILDAGSRDAFLTGLRFEPDSAPSVLTDVRRRAPGLPLTLTTERADLAGAFRALGFDDPAPPIAATCAALALDHAPPATTGIEVRRVATYDEFLVGLDIEDTVFGYSRRDEAAAIYEQRRARPREEWLAFCYGRAVAYGSAVAGPLGLYLSGGGTLPDARGRGAYRALVRARWEHAVKLGTPALVVHAQDASRPILEQLGFRRVATIHELELAA